MFKCFVDVQLNNSNLVLCIPRKLVIDWNENTRYDGKNFYIRKNIPKCTRRHIAIVDRMLKMKCDDMWKYYEIDLSATTLKLDLI